MNWICEDECSACIVGLISLGVVLYYIRFSILYSIIVIIIMYITDLRVYTRVSKIAV